MLLVGFDTGNESWQQPRLQLNDQAMFYVQHMTIFSNLSGFDRHRRRCAAAAASRLSAGRWHLDGRKRESGLAIQQARRVQSRCPLVGSREYAWKQRRKSDKHNLEDDGYKERLKEAVDELFKAGFKADAHTYAMLLQQCGHARDLFEGRRVHAHIVESGFDRDRLVSNLLVQMYGKCRNLETACQVFEKICQRNVFSYTIMIDAYAENGDTKEAQKLFDRMPQKNAVSWTAMISGYAKNGQVENARSMFDRMPNKNPVAWTAMVTTYAQNGHNRKALEMFRTMDLEGAKPDDVTFISILDACANLAALREGRLLHENAIACGFESDVKVGNSLVNLYGKCGSLEDARALFDRMGDRNIVSWTTMLAAYAQNGFPDEARSIFNEMPQRSVVSWNAMIAAYADNGHGKKALEMFRLMDLEGTRPDTITFMSSLDACASIPALAEGKHIHADIRESEFHSETKVGNALLNMYGRCGSLVDAMSMFRQMPERDLLSWNTMVGAYAQTGHGKEALGMFQLMALEGVQPEEITFISILSGCCHSGLFKDGLHHFVFMSADYGVPRISDHYVCTIDLLCRSGMLDRAEELLNSMPFEANVVPWMILLTACKVHNDVARAARAAERAYSLDPKVAAPYVMLSNVYVVS